MEATDFLTMKTTNINLRVSPLLKTQLIERGARMCITLSDYIGFVLTKEMLGQNDPKESEEYKALAKKLQKVEKELGKYETLVEPFQTVIGVDTTINGKTEKFEHPTELLQYLLNNFKFTR